MLRKALVVIGLVSVVLGAGPLAAGQDVGAQSLGEVREQYMRALATFGPAHEETRKLAALVDSMSVDLSFGGGSATEYAAAVREASGEKRIVVMPGCEAYHMPAVELEDVTLEGALMPLEFATSEKAGRSLRVNREGDIFIIAPDARLMKEAIPRETQVFSLAEVLESGRVEPDDVLTAVQAALEMDDQGDTGLKYHSETRLLIVRGMPDALDAVRNVLDGVMESASVMRQAAKELEQARRDMEQVRAALQAATLRADQAAKFADRMAELAKEGSASEGEAQEARAEAIDCERRRVELEAQLRLYTEQVARAREQEGSKASQEGGGGRKRATERR